MSQMIAATEVANAQRELDRMKGALRSWLKYRALNDRTIAQSGNIASSKAMAPQQRLAIAVTARKQNEGTDTALARQLHALLASTMPTTSLPAPSASSAPALARLALGEQPTALAGPFGLTTGGITAIAIVAGVLLMVTTAIKSNADLAAEKERLACIQSGACTDSGFWFKWGAIGLGVWFAWTHLGLGEATKGAARRLMK